MFRVNLVVVMALLVSPAALAQKLGEVDKVAPSMSAPRGEVLEGTSAEGKPYWYRLPKKIDQRRPPNLVFMLHGTGMSHGWAFWNYPIGSGQFRGGDIVIAPEGMTPGHGNTFNFVQNKKDGDQIAGLIKEFKKEFPIGKVYLYGHSQGAFFCYWFAGDYTELVDGIVAHAGNVLSVNHNKLAKQKVAVAILHGEADAVVSVDCAYRTEKIYKEQGYQKLRLEVVKGLNEQTGHWPLPGAVGLMFEWLDQVSSDSPQQTIAVAWSELGKENPDLSVVSDAVEKTPGLLRKHKGDDKTTLEQRLALLQQFLADVEAAHSDAILEQVGAKPGTEYLPWVPHFVMAHAAFADSSSWQKSMKAVITVAKKHDKTAQKAVDRINKRADKKSVADAIAAVESSPLSSDYRTLVQLIDRNLEPLPKGLKEDVVEEHRGVLAGRTEPDTSGLEKAREITATKAQAFRTENAAAFED